MTQPVLDLVPLWTIILGAGVFFYVLLDGFDLGVGILFWGRRTLLAGGTNVDPSLPATAVVTSGPYRLSRNPLYVGLALVYFGLTLALDSWWGIVLLVAVLIVMHRGVIQREERYLEQKFGDGYRQYRSTVRRYI